MLRNWVVFNKLPPEQLIRIKHIHVFEGGRSALFITSGDVVYALGVNGNYNLLGLSGKERGYGVIVEPVNVERLSLKSIYTLAVGDHFGVANNTNGELYHWGRRMDKRRGILLPHQVKCPYFVTDIACGSEFFVIITKERKVYFRGTFQQNDHPLTEFTEISLGLSVSYVSCGIFHVAMLTAEGQVYTCGYDHHATYRTWKPEEGMVPKKMELREHCVQVVCGRRSTVCVLTSGSVWACGENDNLGVESDNSVMKYPVRVKISEPIRELAATWFSNIYAASAWNGRIYSWGNKKRWPAIIPNACVLLDAFHNKETPSSLGMVPVAPQLSPCSSFNLKTAIRKPLPRSTSICDAAQRLERSLSADDLTSASYEEAPQVDDNAPEPAKRTSLPKPLKPIPGLSLLMNAGKYLATRPTDRNVRMRTRAVSPEAHPAKVPKPTFSLATNLNNRAHSMESLEQLSPLPKRKPRVLSVIFGKNVGDDKKTPSPDVENPPPCLPPKPYDQSQPSKPLESSLPPKPSDHYPVFYAPNPFSQSNSLYPHVPQPIENGVAKNYIASTEHYLARNSEPKISKDTSTNPFLYDPIAAVEFEFPKDAAECYVNKQKSVANPTELSTKDADHAHNPGTKALLDYYSLLADIKSDMVELQNMINDLADVIADL